MIDPGNGRYGAAPFNFPGTAHERMQDFMLVFNHVFSPTTMMLVRAGILRSNIDSYSSNSHVINAATTMGFPCTATSCVNLGASNPFTNGIPSAEYDTGYTPVGDDAYVPLYTYDTTFQYNVALHHTRGAHNFRWGVQLIRRQVEEGQSNFPRGDMEFSGAIPGIQNAAAEMLVGDVSSFQRIYTFNSAALRSWEPSAYMADDWHFSKNLTLNLGVRYDVFTMYTCANNACSNFDPTTQLLAGPAFVGVQASNSHMGLSNDYSDIGPRLGFAYKMGHELVLRGGFGISYFSGNYGSGGTFRNPPYAYQTTCGTIINGIPCASNLQSPDGSGAYFMPNGMPTPVFDWSRATNRALYAAQLDTNPNLVPNYAKQWSMQIEKEFAGNVVTIGYVGVFGSRLSERQEGNQLSAPLPGSTIPANNPNPGGPVGGAVVGDNGAWPFPLVPGVQVFQLGSGGNSRYNALQTSIVRRFRAGLSGQFSYTWSHEVSNTPILDEDDGGSYDNCWGPCHVDNMAGGYNIDKWQKFDWGPYDANMTNQFRLALNYQLPWGKSLKGVEAQIAKGWSVVSSYSYSTGFPFTVYNGSAAQSDMDLAAGNDRPDLLHNPNMSSGRSADHWFDTNAFQTQLYGTIGNQGRNVIYGPAQQALNFSIWKDFPIHESIKLQFRCETFNLMNTPSLNTPNHTFGQSSLATITSTTPQAYQREIQFALKLLF